MEEKRKGFSGFILLGIKCLDWLADVVEAMKAQRKEDFAITFRDEVKVLKVRIGSNKASCFLEVAIFVKGGRKGVIRLPEGRGGWGWQRFVDELRVLVEQLVEEELPMVPAGNAGEVGSSPSLADHAVNAREVGRTSCTKSSVLEAQAPMSNVESSLRSWWPLPELEVLRSLATDFWRRSGWRSTESFSSGWA